MSPANKLAATLLGSSALGFACHGLAFAQAGAAPTAGQTSTGQLEEVVVTATRQSSTVNRVPLSITAETQQALDKQGIRNVGDLQKLVPGLNVSAVNGGVAQFAIRGIVATQGAATTGVYIDDTNLTKRNNQGAGANNGAPTPPLFDLQRVEVLRGPQGTLYGGSSEGGTLRFITAAPSLTTYSGNARATVSDFTGHGDPSYDVGVAVGGPIVQDKLGFRVSLFGQRTGGYINRVNAYNNFAIAERNINRSDAASFRAALLWAPVEKGTVSIAWYHSYNHDNANTNTFYLPNGNSYSTPSTCYNTTRQFGASPSPTAAVACPANAVPGQTVAGIYQRPAQSYGPLAVGSLSTFDPVDNQATTTLDVVPLTLGYDLGWADVKSITSLVVDQTHSFGPGNTAEVAQSQTTTAFPTSVGFLLYAPNPLYMGTTVARNNRQGLSQEIRFSSNPSSSRLSWVGGLYVSDYKTSGDYCQARPVDQFNLQLFGITTLQRYGALTLADNCGAERHQSLEDIEYAGFGEANYNITSKLKVIAGVRVSRTEFKYSQSFFGALVGWDVPTVANSGLTSGDVKDTPVTPKFGVQYQLTPNNLLYVTAAKGFRAGGVNSPLSVSVCGVGLASVGLTVNDIPTTFASDSVWSYEAGAKTRLLDGRLQVNTSIYEIDWTGVQLTVSGIGGTCNQTYVANGGTAKSQGVEFESQARVMDGLTGSLAVDYNDARYTQNAYGPRPISGAAATVLVRQGDQFPVPEWTVDLGLQYEFRWREAKPYVRADYSFQGAYLRTAGPGVTSFAPDSYQASAVRRLDLRAGFPINKWEVNLFANNVLNSEDTVANGGGRTGCSVAQGAACTTFTAYQPYLTEGITRPREVGIQTLYRF